MSRTALITGASSGIGAAFARALAKDGYDLILVARREDRLRALADEVTAGRAVRAEVIPADLTERDAAQRLFEAVQARGMQVDLLINNAGFGLHGPFGETAWTREQQMIDLNITALTALCKVFLPPMRARRDGGVINVASTAAFQAMPYFAVYAATKAYVLSFSEALAQEAASDGVRVVCLCPGPTESEFTEKAEFKTNLVEKAPFMTAEAVAAEGLAALRAGRVVQVAGFLNTLTAVVPRFLPRGLVTRVTAAVFKPNR
jgi:hypothetical protein